LNIFSQEFDGRFLAESAAFTLERNARKFTGSAHLNRPAKL
jgi:hypothetical protein